MADSIRTENSKAEQLRLQLEQKNDRELRDIKAKNKLEVDRTIATSSNVKENLDKDYEVSINTKRDEYQQKLEDVRAQNEHALAEAKQNGEIELEKVKSRYQEFIARYKEQSEKKVEDIRKQTEAQVSNIKGKSVKAERKGPA